MSQKSSDPQAISFVSQPLKRDILHPGGESASRDELVRPGSENVTHLRVAEELQKSLRKR